MENDKSVMAVIRTARPSFCNVNDKVAFVVHASFVKTKKKAKPQKLSLAELASYDRPKPAQSEPVGLTHEDRMSLPTGPRERTEEELDRSREFRSYGRGGDREESNSKWGSQRRERQKASDRDAPSRADGADDWGAGKRSIGGNGWFDRKERVR